MKTSNRVAAKVSAKSARQQVETAQGQIEPPLEEFAVLKEHPERPGEFYLEWSNGARQAIDRKSAASCFYLHQIPDALKPYFIAKPGVLGWPSTEEEKDRPSVPWNELEDAVDEIDALMAMLMTQIEHPLKGGKWSTHVICGMLDIVHRSTSNLRRLSEIVSAATRPNPMNANRRAA